MSTALAPTFSIDGGSTQGEDKVSKVIYYRIEDGKGLPRCRVILRSAKRRVRLNG
jgi:hypothetical protein